MRFLRVSDSVFSIPNDDLRIAYRWNVRFTYFILLFAFASFGWGRVAQGQFVPLPSQIFSTDVEKSQDDSGAKPNDLADTVEHSTEISTESGTSEAALVSEKQSNDEATDGEVVRDIRLLRDLITKKLDKRIKFDVEASVTHTNHSRTLMRFQNGTARLSGHLAQMPQGDLPDFGSVLRVCGRTRPKSWQVDIDRWEDTGKSSVPQAKAITFARGEDDHKNIGVYCQVVGDLVEVTQVDGIYRFLIRNPGGVHTWCIREYLLENDVASLIGRQVTVGGVAHGEYDRDDQFQRIAFHAMQATQMQASPDSTTKPELANLKGTVVCKDDRQWIGVSDSHSIHWFRTNSSEKIPLMSRVDVLHEPFESGETDPTAIVRVVKVSSQDTVAPTQVVEASALADLHGMPDFVTTTGKIKAVIRRNGHVHLRLGDDDVTFAARVMGSADGMMANKFGVGNIVELTGVRRSFPAPHVGVSKFSLVVNDPADVNVRSRPIQLYAKQIGMIAAGIAGFILIPLALIMGWVWSMQKKQRSQQADEKSVALRLQASCDAICEGIFCFDAQQRLVLASGKSTEFIRQDELQKMDAKQVGDAIAEHFETPEHFRRQWRDAFDDEDTNRAQEICLGDDGRDLTLRVSPVVDQDGHFDGRVSTLTDVTDRRRMEQEFSQSQKLAAVDRLAGGIAHDFNNLLMAISANVSLARQHAGELEKVEHHTQIAEDAVKRASHLTQQLLSFSRRNELSMEVGHLNDCVNKVGALMRHMLDDKVDLCLKLSSNLWAAQIDPIQIEHVLLNLCINANDAIEALDENDDRERQIIVRTRNVKHVDLGACVEVTVEDNGVGMSEATSASAFEPFFTTKDVGQGTGLGLAMSLGIVQQHGGLIESKSQMGQGSKFVLLLPKTDDPFVAKDDETQVTIDRVSLPNASKRILLVDDEPMIRDAGSALLSALGHGVVCAADGQHALSLLSDDARFDVVLLDLTMPVMSGRETLKQIKTRFPGLRVVICSGYSVDLDSLGDDVQFAPEAVLAKPFSTEDIRRVLSPTSVS